MEEIKLYEAHLPILAAANYGKACSFELLVIAGTSEHNGYRYEHIIPWSSTEDAWVSVSTRITGSTIKELDSRQVRNFKLD